MAITLTDSPASTREGETINLLTAGNGLFFEFTAGAGETSLQVQIQTTAGAEIGTLPTLPFFSTLLDVDVAYILRNSLSNDDSSDNDRGVNSFTGIGSTKQFKLAYRVGGTGSYTVLATIYTACNAVRQIGSTYGTTLAEYTPLMTGTTVNFTGKFLTRFTNPVLFWYSDVTTPSASTQVSVWQSQLAFPLRTADFTVVQVLRAVWIGATSNTQSYVDTGTSTNIITFPIPTAEIAYQYNTVAITVGTNNGAGNLGNTAIDTLTFEIRRACKNPKAIKWLNSLGAWECWVFEGRTPMSLETESTGEYGIYPRVLSTATETRRNFSKTARNVISVFADNLTLDQVQALSEIAYSPNVIMYAGALTGGIAFEDWQGVTVDGGSFQVEDTYNTKHKISFDLAMVDIQTISN